MKKDEITSKQIWIGILLVLILLAGFAGSQWLSSRNNSKETIENISQKVDSIQKSISPYQRKDSMKKLVLINNFSNSVKNTKTTNRFNKKISITGQVKSGYLYVKASVDNAPLTNYDDIFLELIGNIKNQDQELGGHLIQPNDINVPTDATSTEFLMDLSDVRYKPSYNSSGLEAVSGDWLTLINNGTSQFVIGFSSTERSGLIEEISLYYECADTDCSITTN